MSDDRTWPPDAGERDPLSADLAAVEQRLIRDGQAWQSEMPASPRLTAYIHSRVPRTATPRANQRGQRSLSSNRYDNDTRAAFTAENSVPGQSWPRRVLALAAATVVVLALAFALLHARSGVSTSPAGPGSGIPTTATSAPITTPLITDGAVIVSPVPGVTTPIAWVVTAPTNLDVKGDTSQPDIGVTYKFTIDQPVVVIAKLKNGTAKAGDVVSAQWFLNDRDVTTKGEKSVTLSNPIPDAVYLSLYDLLPGNGEVKIAYNGVQAYIADFVVLVPTTAPTPTPAPGTGGSYPPATPCSVSYATPKPGIPSTPSPKPNNPSTPTPTGSTATPQPTLPHCTPATPTPTPPASPTPAPTPKP